MMKSLPFEMKSVMQWGASVALFGAAVLVGVSGCGAKKGPQGLEEVAATGGICVDNYPLAYFAQTVVGEAVEVAFMAPMDEDPAFWVPDDEGVRTFQAAKLILMNGAGYAKWVDQVTLPASRVVETTAGFKSALIEEEEAVTHSHGGEGEHSHAGVAFTTWIDFQQAGQQLAAVEEAALLLLEEEGRGAAAERVAVLQGKLKEWDERLLAVGKALAGRALLGSHPVYQYLARRYQLNLQAVHWEPEEVPGEEALGELRELLKEHPATVMIWEGEPAAASVALLKKLGIESLVFDPCGNRPETGDFSAVMETNVKALEALVH
jgi:zinc transport system substrate-binding protein